MRQYPQAFAESLNAADMLIQGIAEVAVIGDRADGATVELMDVLHQPYRPNLISAFAEDNVDQHELIPLLNARVKRDGKATVLCLPPFRLQDAGDHGCGNRRIAI